MAKATKRYSASGWATPFAFSISHRRLLQGRVGLSAECVSRIEAAIEIERSFADILSEEPTASEVEKALDDGAKTTANLLTWLTQVDARTKSVIEPSSYQRTGKFLSDYKPAIKELSDTLQLAKKNLPEKKRARPRDKYLLRLASIIADEIEMEGHNPDSTQNGPVCQTFSMALDTIGIKRSSPSHIVKKMLKLKECEIK